MAFKRIEKLPNSKARMEKTKLDRAKAGVAEENRLNRWRRVFGTEDGLLVLNELLDRTGAMDSIYETSAKIHYNSGRQDLGLEILADVMLADRQIYHNLIELWATETTRLRVKTISGGEE
jgi:hypothetical protein